jgi:O-antigen/teichoic acid export membrane protein
MHRAILPGVLDAGLASLATFAVGLVAARFLEPTVLGGYALVFSVFVLACMVPAQLLFRPAEVIAASLPDADRLGLLRRTLRLGALATLLPALAVSLWTIVAPSDIPLDAMVALTVTGVASTFVSPIQDHVRRMLHMGNASWRAAAVSAIQVSVAVAGSWSLIRAGVPMWWVPFGALAAANILSLLAGWALAHGGMRGEGARVSLSVRQLTRSGRWLVVAALVPAATAVVVSTLVSHLAGPTALGYAEAARVIGQPPWVLAMGLTAVLGPRSIRAARKREFATAQRASRVFAALMLGCGVPYLAAVGFGWSWNPLVGLVPNAYAVGGLVALTIVANIVNGMEWPYRFELIGGGREKALVRVEAAGNAVRGAVAATAGVIGSFAPAVGLVALSAVRSLGYRSALRALYGDAAEATDRSAEAAGQMRGSEI